MVLQVMLVDWRSQLRMVSDDEVAGPTNWSGDSILYPVAASRGAYSSVAGELQVIYI